MQSYISNRCLINSKTSPGNHYHGEMVTVGASNPRAQDPSETLSYHKPGIVLWDLFVLTGWPLICTCVCVHSLSLV